jgi:hypothetical protein
MSHQPITPEEFISEAIKKDGEAHVMLGGSSGLTPSLADAMNGWYERCEIMLLKYPDMTEIEKTNYHRAFFKAIWVELGYIMEGEYMMSRKM